jgi:phosphate starvation-inducible protein PhoH and related proteins
LKRTQKTKLDIVQKEKFIRQQFPVLLPKNDNQAKLMEGLKYNSLVVTTGSSGTGKTFIACAHAAKKLHYKDIEKIVLIRAYQPLAGRSIGFLPGTLEEKLIPYYQQMLDYLEDFLGKGSLEIALKNKTIEICSLETIRGRSWENAIVLADECQNMYVQEVQALTTRIGENTQLIMCGDNSGIQTDAIKGTDGLTYLEKLCERYDISDSSFTKFTSEDIVRSGIVKEFVLAYESELVSTNPIVTVESANSQTKKGR